MLILNFFFFLNVSITGNFSERSEECIIGFTCDVFFMSEQIL